MKRYVSLTGDEEKHEGKVRITCPFCKDKTPSCIVSAVTMNFLCFSCGSCGPVEYTSHHFVRIFTLHANGIIKISNSLRFNQLSQWKPVAVKVKSKMT